MRLSKPYLPERFLLIILFCTCLLTVQAKPIEPDSDSSLRKKILLYGNGIAYTSAIGGLYQLWYSDYPMGKFHFFNDNKEWLQMDKIGHAYSCYYEGLVGKKMMLWAGYSEKTSTVFGGSYGFLIQSSIEILDGFSDNWGASWGDMLANGAGTGLFIGQELLWKEQRIGLKVSYNPSPYAPLRPNVLGSSMVERTFKDYNGQTYWLSLNPSLFMKEQTKFPKYLNIALGYGADGMIGGFNNTVFQQDGTIKYYSIDRNRQFYLAPDIDLTKIPVKKTWVKTTLVVLNCLKFPLPGLGFDKNKNLQFHWLLF